MSAAPSTLPIVRHGVAAPLGAVRIAGRQRGQQVRQIKVRMDGPPATRWVNYARIWWMRNRGPIPEGKRVIHLDGDSLNDDPSNLTLGDAGDAIFLWHDLHPERSRKAYAACRAGTIRMNVMRGAINRATSWLRNFWYPVDWGRKLVHDRPQRERWRVFADFGFADAWRINGTTPAALLGWPGLTFIQARILAALADGGPATLRELRTRIDAMRSHMGGGRPCPLRCAILSSMTPLRMNGWIISARKPGRRWKHYELTDAGRTSRGPVCPIFPVRGRDIPREFERAAPCTDRLQASCPQSNADPATAS